MIYVQGFQKHVSSPTPCLDDQAKHFAVAVQSPDLRFKCNFI